jgi:hypothetical protein
MYRWEIWKGQEVVAIRNFAEDAVADAKVFSLGSIYTYTIKRVEVVDFGRVKGGEFKLPAGITEEPSGRDGYGTKGY